MTGLTHLLVGGVIASRTKNVWLGMFFAFLSHFVFDFIPHNDYIYFYLNNWQIVYVSQVNIIILIIGGLLLLWLVRGFSLASFKIYLGAFFAVLPDISIGVGELFGFSYNFIDRVHMLLHTRWDLGELLFVRLTGGTLLHEPGSYLAWAENWHRISLSAWGNIGWGIEMAVELLVIVWAARFLRQIANGR